MSKPRIKIPDSAKVGDVIEIKTLISHVMETGQRKDRDGKIIPRDIINTFAVSYAGKEVFRAALQPGISANPYIAFHTVATESGTIDLTWTGDNGFSATERINITVE